MNGTPTKVSSEAARSIRTHLLEHPAVKAWSELQLDVVKLEGIHILKPGGKSAVYRLEGVGAGKSAVIAKRCRQATATVERTIYEEVLPHLSLMSLHYYGFAEEEDGQFCWLFLEDAGEEEYSPFLEEHRALAARWLGALHTSVANVPAVASLGLPDRGPRHYLEVLRSARDAIKGNLANPALKSDDVVVLAEITTSYPSIARENRKDFPMPYRHRLASSKSFIRVGGKTHDEHENL